MPHSPLSPGADAGVTTLKAALKNPVIFDDRNMDDAKQARSLRL